MTRNIALPDPLTPQALEAHYRSLQDSEARQAFLRAIQARYEQDPDDPLLAAWYYRLTWAASPAQERVIPWRWAIPLALLNGLLLWLLSDERAGVRLPGESYIFFPAMLLFWAPITAGTAIVYLTITGERRWLRMIGILAGLAGVSLYVVAAYTHMIPRPAIEQYIKLSAMHLPILALAGLGAYLLAERDATEPRFALLQTMLEGAFLAGLFAIVGGVFMAITTGLFEMLSVTLPEWLIRVFWAGGAGAIPVLIVAMLYDPTRPPNDQPTETGLSKVVGLILRMALPISLAVLTVYVALIPFHFTDALHHRETLIVYTVMLFAVILLLLGVTPGRSGEGGRSWLRWGMAALALLAWLVGLYALYAILYRTWQGSLTPNRVAFIGWDGIHVGLLAWLLLVLARPSAEAAWVTGVHRVFARGAWVYAIWALLMICILPWQFGRAPSGAFSALPLNVQRAAYGRYGGPVLLKCYGSPHVYLLEDGKKRWIKDIPTFRARGFRWADVREVPCEDLRQVPDGPPIPPDAGPPPIPFSRIQPAPTATLPPLLESSPTGPVAPTP